MMFRITSGKGFHITFENGYTVSVQWGPGNYCDNHDVRIYPEEPPKLGWESREAETAVWAEDRDLITLPGDADSVQGYRTPAQVLELLNWAAAQPAKVAVAKEVPQ